MKILFLFLTFCLILSVHAQRSFQQYTCVITHEEESASFYLEMNKKKDFPIEDQTVTAALYRKDNMIEISLSKTTTDVDSANTRMEKRIFPLTSRKLIVELLNADDEKVQHVMLECSPRDP